MIQLMITVRNQYHHFLVVLLWFSGDLMDITYNLTIKQNNHQNVKPRYSKHYFV